MSSGVTLTAATRQNLLSLQGTADLVAQTQNRLSTGKKVNSALDDPTSFFTSQALTGRSGDLNALLNGISNGIQTIQAANQGITSIQKLVDSAKSTANQALADKSAVSSGTAASSASLSGSKTFQASSTNTDGTQDFSSAAKDGSIDISLDGGTSFTTIRLDATTLKGSVSDTSKVSAQQAASAINSQINSNSALKGKVSASVAADGRINFSTATSGSTQQLNVRGSAGSTIDIGYGKDATSGGPTAALVTGGAFSTITAGTGAALSIGDGSTSVDVRIDENSLKADGTTLGTSGTAAQVADAINVQLKAAGSTVAADVAGGVLTFKSQDLGPSSAVTVTGKAYNTTTAASNINIGFGGNSTTTFTTGTLTAGTGAAATGLSATGSDATDGSAKAVVGGNVIVTDPASASATTGGVDLSGSNNASFTIQLGTGNVKTITLDSNTVTTANSNTLASKQEIADAINAQFSADSGLSGFVKASFDASGKLSIASTAAGSTQKVTVQAAQGATANNNVNIGFGVQTSGTPGIPASAAISVTGKDSTGSTNSTRQSLSKQFNELLNQITQQAKDSSYNGINLLYRSSNDESENSLKVTFNETGTSSITVKGTKLDSDGLGLTSVTGGFQTDDEINKTLTAITAATSQLRAQSSTFGSNLSVVQNRQDFSKNLINILDTGSANLTNADLNEEAANSQALSTRQSLGISALSLANQANQGILQLLR